MLFLKSYKGSTESQTINPLQGWQYEYLPWHAKVEIGIAVGGDTQPATAPSYDAFSGSDLLAQGAEAVNKGAQAPPEIQYPYDYNLEDVAKAGDRIGITLTIPGVASAANAVTVAVRVTPLGI